ncbi:hypothetical protein ABEB36_014786 [Hypothenemus hampei]|uniref:Uncharacterized protein n=1 Tax=Hypothenemus hampei TaxID=57062 RepID=A0ABD1E2V7_HYPHA
MPDSHKCERLGGVFFVWPRPPMQDDPSPSRRRDAAHHRPLTTVSPPTTTSEENAVTHAPAVDGTMVSRPGECGARD